MYTYITPLPSGMPPMSDALGLTLIELCLVTGCL